MATPKPRTNVKRPTSSRTVRVAKKKSGVTKTQAFVAAGILALVGVIVVVATYAATASFVHFVYYKPSGVGQLVSTSSDGAVNTEYRKYYENGNNQALSRDKTKIIYYDTKGFEIFRVKDGVKLASLACPAGSVCSPNNKVAWLTGDKTIVYRQSNGEIWTASVDGQASKKLVSAKNGSVPAGDWALNKSGNKLVYVAVNPVSGGTQYALVAIGTDGTGRKVLYRSTTPAGGSLNGLAWSPDGRKIAFQDNNSYKLPNYTKINVINADGTGLSTVRSLSMFSTRDARPSRGLLGAAQVAVWSPGSTSLLYADTNAITRVENLYTVNVSTKKSSRITSNASAATAIGVYAWLPDSRILYGFGPLSGTSYSISTLKTVKPDLTSPKTIYTNNAESRLSPDSITF